MVLDKSGSMNQPVAGTRSSQQHVANEAAALAIESLRSESMVGVVTFDFGAHVHVPLQRNDDPKKIADKVRGIVAEGGTNLLPALETAYQMLKNTEAQRKHIVCLSDGRSHRTDFDDIVKAMNASNIKVTTIAIGDDADHVTLSKLAKDCGGEFYRVQNPKTLPRVLVDSVQIINKPLLKEVPFVPEIKPTGSTLSAGMENAPILDGLVITAVRDDPTVTIEMIHPDGEPLLAHWQAGMGRVAAFTSDANGTWSKRWIDWPGYGSFWAQLARTISRPPTNRDLELTTIIEDGRLKLTLDAIGEKSGFVDYMRVKGIVYTPDASAISVSLQQTAPGRYEGSVPATLPGNYVVAISPQIGTRQLSPVIGGATQSSSPEYRSYQSNRSLLEKIAEATGGRVLEIANPESADLFDRTNMAPSVSSLPAWRNILWIALAMFLVDVAFRRIAWDFALLRRFAAHAIARVTPAHVRGGEAAATLASLRQSGQNIEERLLTQPKEAPQLRKAIKPQRPSPPSEISISSAQSDQSKVATALAALR
ncbi:MAG: VWA domain-containing protein, partial [Chloroflexi bacterium]|nr:VWA domain-containing protein [Chloroflexota bacterium]